MYLMSLLFKFSDLTDSKPRNISQFIMLNSFAQRNKSSTLLSPLKAPGEMILISLAPISNLLQV